MKWLVPSQHHPAKHSTIASLRRCIPSPIQAKERKREAKSSDAMRHQLLEFQNLMARGDAQRKSLERRAAETLELLEAAEEELDQLRTQNEQYRTQLTERPVEPPEMSEQRRLLAQLRQEQQATQQQTAQLKANHSSELEDLRLKNEELLATLNRAEAAALEAKKTSAAVEDLSRSLSEKDEELARAKEEAKELQQRTRELTARSVDLEAALAEATAAQDNTRAAELQLQVTATAEEQAQIQEAQVCAVNGLMISYAVPRDTCHIATYRVACHTCVLTTVFSSNLHVPGPHRRSHVRAKPTSREPRRHSGAGAGA